MSKAKTKEIPFVLPTNFEIVLKHKEKEQFKKVLDWLYEMGNFSYSWEWEMLEKGEQYILTIEGSWADNLLEMVALLGDIGQNER